MLKPTPQPPRPCPICRVAMQSERDGDVVVFRCEACGASIIVAPTRAADPGDDEV